MANYNTASFLNAAAGKAWPLALPIVAYEAGRAPVGEKLPAAEAAVTNMFVLPAAKFGLGSLIGGPLAGLAATFLPTAGLERRIYHGLRAFSTLDRRVRRLECGGDYKDTETARVLRLRAMSEMSGAMAPARRMLGREAELMHG